MRGAAPRHARARCTTGPRVRALRSGGCSARLVGWGVRLLPGGKTKERWNSEAPVFTSAHERRLSTGRLTQCDGHHGHRSARAHLSMRVTSDERRSRSVDCCVGMCVSYIGYGDVCRRQRSGTIAIFVSICVGANVAKASRGSTLCRSPAEVAPQDRRHTTRGLRFHMQLRRRPQRCLSPELQFHPAAFYRKLV